MPGTDAIIVLLIVVGAVIAFVSGKVRFDVISLCVLALLLVLRQLDASQALHGFANPATATVAAMFVLSAGLVRTGLVSWLAQQINRFAGKGERRLLFTLCIVIAVLSAFIINTATVAIFIPVVFVLANARKISASHVLMPLSFASQFGGVCTLIGTSTNILVNGIAITNGLESFGLFEFAPLGLAMAAVGIIYLLIVAPWLLPKRKGEIQKVDKYRLSDYLAELRIGSKSPLLNITWDKSEAGKDKEISLIKLVREDKATWKPTKTKMRAGDILLINGNADKLLTLQDKFGLESRADITVNDEELSSDKIKLVEALVPPRSRLVGRTLRSSDFARRYGLTTLAIQRRGKVLRSRLDKITLDAGDTLLLQGDKNEVALLMKSSDLIVTNELTELYIRKDRALIALLLLVGVVGAAALNIVPILVAALIGAVGMVVGRCLTIEEAYRAIDWQVIFLLGGILPLGLAMEQSGAAAWVADNVLMPFSHLGPVVILAILYLLTAILTETMSNNAAAILIAPFALSFAVQLNVDPRPFLVAITFAASTSFATPVGYQTNTMVYAPGGYRFTDFTRVGAPLNILFLGLAVLLIPLLWPF